MITINHIRTLCSFCWERSDEWFESYPFTGNGWNAKWCVGPYRLEFDRYIRGDVIRLFENDEEVIGFADQSHAYSGLLGLNDIQVADGFNSAKFTLAMQFIYSYEKYSC